MADLISRADAIEAVGKYKEEHGYAYYDCACDIENDLKQLPSASAKADMSEYADRLWKIAYERGKREASAEAVQDEWIPIKWHEITDAEREENGYPREWVLLIDCEMPCDGQEILVQTTNGYIRWDVCYEDGGFSLDSGWDWVEDIVAWMPLPKPYKGGEDEKVKTEMSLPKWIPCEERLPSKDGRYLIVGRQGAVNILPYRDGRWYGRWGVIAWMPLPEPYREDGEV